MTTEIIALIILGIAFIVCNIGLIVTGKDLRNLKDRVKNELYQDKIWENFIENINNFKYSQMTEYKPNKIAHVWLYGNYKIFVWLDKKKRYVPYSSIHVNNHDGTCVISDFNTYRSKEMARKLLHKLWKENIRVW